MKEQKHGNNILMIVTLAFSLAAFIVVFYYFQHESVRVDGYTVVYYKNRCDIDPKTLTGDFESLKAMPCLIRINWRTVISSDMEQEYCYLPDRGIEKTRLIHKKNGNK